ncbi:MAG: glycosyltransferase [Muribaculaceae bacterium]
MKVLQVNCVFQKGSTGKIVNDIHTCLVSNGFESIVCYGRGNIISEKSIYKFCSETESKIHSLLFRIGVILPYGGLPFATSRLLSIIKRENPDVVHLQCINGSCVNIYRLLKHLGTHHIKTIVTHHAEFFYTGSCGHSFDCIQFTHLKGCSNCQNSKEATRCYTINRTNEAWCKMQKAFAHFNKSNLIFSAVSPWVKERSALSEIVNKFPCVLNGIETSIFHRIKDNTSILKQIPNCMAKIVLHVSASFDPANRNHIKGSWYVVEIAKRMPDTTFIIVASHNNLINNLPNNIHIWGPASSQNELASLYSLANVTLIASKRETFSMICAESLCCGTPIIGFKAGGPETIAIPKYSEFVEYGNIENLYIAIIKMINCNIEKEWLASTAQKKYDKEVMTKGFIKLYNDILRQ